MMTSSQFHFSRGVVAKYAISLAVVPATALTTTLFFCIGINIISLPKKLGGCAALHKLFNPSDQFLWGDMNGEFTREV